ncbi:MAG: hypothetical protein LBJ32_01410 [Oscillospiraceae bacterium]|jgi:hypothetical protein|nr:hypothetical protein [Oscillospiraceae bacterium]
MKDMIKKILDADKRIGEALDSSEFLRTSSVEHVRELLENRRKEYLDKARTNIKVIEKIEKVKSESRISDMENKCEEVLEKIEKAYNENKEDWVKIIVDQILKI